jgi:hypothetical protein
VVYNILFYFITKNIQFRIRKFQKNIIYASFQFYFLYIFLIGGNLVSKYEQLLILTDIDASTLTLTGMRLYQKGIEQIPVSLM